jgi:hypothetical protein
MPCGRARTSTRGILVNIAIHCTKEYTKLCSRIITAAFSFFLSTDATSVYLVWISGADAEHYWISGADAEQGLTTAMHAL